MVELTQQVRIEVAAPAEHDRMPYSAVPFAQHEPVPVLPVGPGGIDVQIFIVENREDLGHTQRTADVRSAGQPVTSIINLRSSAAVRFNSCSSCSLSAMAGLQGL